MDFNANNETVYFQQYFGKWTGDVELTTDMISEFNRFTDGIVRLNPHDNYWRDYVHANSIIVTVYRPAWNGYGKWSVIRKLEYMVTLFLNPLQIVPFLFFKNL